MLAGPAGEAGTQPSTGADAARHPSSLPSRHARRDDAAAVARLVGLGVDVNVHNAARETALLLAVQRGHLAVVGLAACAPQDACGSGTVARPLESAYPPSVFRDVRLGGAARPRQVQQLLTSGAVPDGEDEAGWTPLLAAAARGHTEVAHALLERNANASRGQATAERKTPLMFAAYLGNDVWAPSQRRARHVVHPS